MRDRANRSRDGEEAGKENGEQVDQQQQDHCCSSGPFRDSECATEQQAHTDLENEPSKQARVRVRGSCRLIHKIKLDFSDQIQE